MRGITFVNGLGNDAFIPLHAIDQITISQIEDSGKWNMTIHTIGGNGGQFTFDTKEAAKERMTGIIAIKQDSTEES